jgi:SacI homology domain
LTSAPLDSSLGEGMSTCHLDAPPLCRLLAVLQQFARRSPILPLDVLPFCRLLAILSDAVSPLGAGCGMYFSSAANVTNSLQRGHAVDDSKPLWQRSNTDFWWNAALSEPLCRARPASLRASAHAVDMFRTAVAAQQHGLLAVCGAVGAAKVSCRSC